MGGIEGERGRGRSRSGLRGEAFSPGEGWQRRHEWLRRVAQRLAGSTGEADDLAQETWLAFFATERQARSPRRWLVAILRRRLALRCRTEAHRRAREREAYREEPHPAPEEVLGRSEVLASLREAVDQLPAPLAETVRARYFEGLSTTEIARRTGVTSETVRVRLRRARAELRSRLARRFGGEDLLGALFVLAARDGRRGATPSPLPRRTAGPGDAAGRSPVLLGRGARPRSWFTRAAGIGAASLLAWVGLLAPRTPGRTPSEQAPRTTARAGAVAPGRSATGGSTKADPRGRESGRLPVPAGRRTAGVGRLVLTDSATGSPLEDYAVALADGRVLWSDARGILAGPFDARGERIRLLDDPAAWRRRGASTKPAGTHPGAQEEPAPPVVSVRFDPTGTASLSVVTGPAFELEPPPPPEEVWFARLEAGRAAGALAGQQAWARGSARVRTRADGSAWVRFLPLTAELASAPLPWRLVLWRSDGLRGAEGEVTQLRQGAAPLRLAYGPRARLELHVDAPAGFEGASGFARLVGPCDVQRTVPLAPDGEPTRFFAVPAGRHHLEVRAPLHESAEFDITLAPAEAREFVVALRPLAGDGAVGGRVETASGGPAAIGLAVLHDLERRLADRFTLVQWGTEEGRHVGRFRFEGVARGRYTLRVVGLDAHPITHPAQIRISPPFTDARFRVEDEVPADDVRFVLDADGPQREGAGDGSLAVFYRRPGGAWSALARVRGARRWDVRVGEVGWTQRAEPVVPGWPRGEPLEWVIVGDGIAPAHGDERDLEPDARGGLRVPIELEPGWSVRLLLLEGEAPGRPLPGVLVRDDTRSLGVSNRDGTLFLGGPGAPRPLVATLRNGASAHIPSRALELGDPYLVPVRLAP